MWPPRSSQRTADLSAPERTLWRLTKDGRTAEAVVRSLPLGDEVRITVAGVFLTSSLFRNDAEGLVIFARGLMGTFTHKGWVEEEPRH